MAVVRISRSGAEKDSPRLSWPGRQAGDLVVEPAFPSLMQRWGHSDEAGELMLGDNLGLLASLEPGSVRLAYLDPPFFSGQRYLHRTRAGERSFTAPAFEDRWKESLPEYLSFLEDRLRLVARALASDGSLYVHLDSSAVHYVKVLLDEIMGKGRFSRQIIWRIGWVSGYKTRVDNWVRNHDVILYYARPGAHFEKKLLPHPEGYSRRSGPPGEGRPIEDVWTDLPSIQLMSFTAEKTGWSTQKSEALLRRIVQASSRPADLVLDPFCGAGTTAVAAASEGRRFVAMDSSSLAIHLARCRLLDGGVSFTVSGTEPRPAGPVVAEVEQGSGGPSVALRDVPEAAGPVGAGWRECLDAWWLVRTSKPASPIWFAHRRRARKPALVPDTSSRLRGVSHRERLNVVAVDLAGRCHVGEARPVG